MARSREVRSGRNAAEKDEPVPERAQSALFLHFGHRHNSINLPTTLDSAEARFGSAIFKDVAPVSGAATSFRPLNRVR